MPGITKAILQEQLRQSRGIWRTQQPVRKELGAQTLEALTTGGVGARIPMIQRAVESANLAGSNAMRGLEQGLAQRGLAGTPFGQAQLAQLGQQQQFAASQIPTQYAQSLISAAGGGAQPQFGSLPGAAGSGGGGGGFDLSGLGTMLGNLFGKRGG
jgi:hypothetical protein